MGKQTLYQQIHDDILAAIQDGTYKEGDALPSEIDLAAQYGVSRITTKQALNLLAAENHIIRKQGRGSIVISAAPSQDADLQEQTEQITDSLRLIGGDGKTICVIFDSFDFAFGCDLLRGIEWQCSRKGYRILFQCTYGSIEYEQTVIRRAVDAGVAGIIIMCVQNEVFDEQILRLVLNDFPVILVDRKMAKIPIPAVCTDNYAAAGDLTRLLLQKGHRKIGFVTHVYHDTSTIQERMTGFTDAMAENGILCDESDWLTSLKTGTPLELGGTSQIDQEDHDAIVDFVSHHLNTTAYFALNYKCGVKMILALRELGMENSVDVVFFDGPESIVMRRPYYARVLQDEIRIGETAVDLLEQRMNGEKPANTTYIPYRIIY